MTSRALRWIVTSYVLGVAISGLAGYLGFLGIRFPLDLFVTPPPVGVRALGFTSHPLHLATSCVFAVALAIWLGTSRHGAGRWIGRIGVLAVFLGLYASGSRGGNVAGVAALALSAVCIPSVRRRIYTVLAAIGLALAAVLIFLPSVGTAVLRTTRVYGGLTNEVSDAGRSQILSQAVDDFRQAPGWGIGVRYLAEAHILYFGVLASGGVILALAFLAFTGGSLSAIRRLALKDRDLGGALLATIVASLVYWTVADDFQVASVGIVYGVVMAGLELQHEQAPKLPVRDRLRPRTAHPLPTYGR